MCTSIFTFSQVNNQVNAYAIILFAVVLKPCAVECVASLIN